MILHSLDDFQEVIIVLGKQFISLDWHPKAKELFYKERKAEELDAGKSSSETTMTQHNKITILDECLQLYTSSEKLAESDAWWVK